MTKVKSFISNFYNLNLEQNIFTNGNYVYSTDGNIENVLLSSSNVNVLNSSASINFVLSVTGTGIFTLDSGSYDISQSIDVDDVVYLDFNLSDNIDNFRDFFKVQSVNVNSITLNGSSNITTSINNITFNESILLNIYIYSTYDIINEVNTFIDGSDNIILESGVEKNTSSQSCTLSTIGDGIFTLTSSVSLGLEENDIIKIGNSLISKYNSYYRVNKVDGNVITMNGSSTLFVNGTSDNDTSVLSIFLYNVKSYLDNENILNILNLDDIFTQLGTLDPVYFNDLSNELFKNVNNKNNRFNLVISETISNIISKKMNKLMIYYTEDIIVERDFNVGNFLKSINLLNYMNDSRLDSNDILLKDSINSELKLLDESYNSYDVFKDEYLKIVSRDEKPKFGWIKKLGSYIFSEVELYFNDLLIDKQYPIWINAWNELNVTNNELFSKMIGDVEDLTEVNSDNKLSKNLLIPFRFWFCRYSGMNIPLIAMINTDIVLKLKLNNINNLVKKPENTEVVLLSEFSIELIGNYIYLDEKEREIFSNARHEYLIEQVFFNGKEFLNSTEKTLNIYFKNSIKELIWVLDYDKDLNNVELSDYTLENKNPFLKCKIFTNNKNIIEQDGVYFNYVVPYENYKSAPSEGINVYKFGINNMDFQPSGTINFSMLDKVEMYFNFNSSISNLSNKNIHIYAVGYNILRIMSGQAGIAFVE